MTELDSTVASVEGAATPDTTSAVQLTVPADVSFVGIVRSLTASLAARGSLNIDEIDDLRIAVDEACALLVPHAVPGSSLAAHVEVAGDSILLSVAVEAVTDASLDKTGYGWTVLEALADTVSTSHDAGRLGITLGKASDPSGTDLAARP